MSRWTYPLCLLLMVTCLRQTHAQQQPERKHINFDAGWRFHFGDASDPERDFNYGIADIFSKEASGGNTPVSPRFRDSSWEEVQLPHDWVASLPFVHSPDYWVVAHGYKPVGGLFPKTSIGWYRKTFWVPDRDSTRRYSVQFDGIFRDSKVWLNGNYLGSNFSGYIGATYDLTDFLNYSGPNVLVVRVNATQYEGWFYEGAGIYRHAWLNEYPQLHIDNPGVFVHSTSTPKQATVTVETPLTNAAGSPEEAELLSYITERDGRVVGRAKPVPVHLAEGTSGTFTQQIQVSSPRLWSLEDPYLYRVVCLLRSGDRVVDSIRIRFGIRTITVDDHLGLFLNGRHVEIQGVCCHQDHAGVGSALPDYLQYYRIGLLKQMGANAYRTSHNPPTPELLDACDSLGMLVLDENRLLNSSSEYESQFKREIIRDRNHPSVFMWSLANEEGWVQTTPVGKRIAQSLMRLQQKLDPTRTCTYAADVGNTFQGVNEVIPVRGFNYRISAIDAYHKDHPDQPVMGTEMGSTTTDRGIYRIDSVNGYLTDLDTIHPWWATTAEYWWTLAAARPWFMGGFVWTGFDYRGEPTPFDWPNISSHFGVMDACGFPKNIYYYYKAWWSDSDVLHIAPHWNWKGREGQPILVWVDSNADSVKLSLNGEDLGTKTMPRQGHLEWTVPYSPGTLSALGYRKGMIFTDTVQTTGDPVRISLQATRSRIQATGEDAVVVNVDSRDAAGREVPLAQDLIRFTVQGPGRIIGVGNGDPSSHEPDQCEPGKWERHLFNGKCQVILEAGSKPGDLLLAAEALGLRSDSCVIRVDPAQP